MATTMRTASVTAYGQPLAFPEWPMPTSHLDLHPANGDWPRKPTLPFIPGHKAVGRGHFEHCLQARETLFAKSQKFSVVAP